MKVDWKIPHGSKVIVENVTPKKVKPTSIKTLNAFFWKILIPSSVGIITHTMFNIFDAFVEKILLFIKKLIYKKIITKIFVKKI